MKQVLCIPKRKPYITRSNKWKLKKTPFGNKVAVQIKKRGKAPSCGDCKKKLDGIKPARPAVFARLKKYRRTVTRVYGGVLCHKCLKSRILESYFESEQITYAE